MSLSSNASRQLPTFKTHLLMVSLSLFSLSLFPDTFTLLNCIFPCALLHKVSCISLFCQLPPLPDGLLPFCAENRSGLWSNRTRHFQSWALCSFSLAQLMARFWNNFEIFIHDFRWSEATVGQQYPHSICIHTSTLLKRPYASIGTEF